MAVTPLVTPINTELLRHVLLQNLTKKSPIIKKSMAFKNRSVDEEVMKMAEFKKWMLKKFDEDGDGKLSPEELREAIRAHGGWFCRLKSRRALKKIDHNGNGLIDEDEMSHLIDFAHKHLNIKVVA